MHRNNSYDYYDMVRIVAGIIRNNIGIVAGIYPK